jgi:hypothetical protein
MSVRRLLVVAPTLGLGAVWSATPESAPVAMMSAGRGGSLAAGVVALLGVVVGAAALKRPADAQRWGLAAAALGVIGIAGGGIVVGTADGGVGTGNGLAGGFVAMALGLAAVVLGGLAFARSRRTG